MIWYLISAPFWLVGCIGILLIMVGAIYATHRDLMEGVGTGWCREFISGAIAVWVGSSVLLLIAYGIARMA